eukprot:TRINITY_DN1995_c0_g1_i1.p1 TRINITY_DN1995_c0_g1~~TRINITY_DN1995_c0_g1_i1.p1  ORF type:complete len:282 (+),score=118.10 TRINITY_DN1995_c0_g1_i1:54-848(+)
MALRSIASLASRSLFRSVRVSSALTLSKAGQNIRYASSSGKKLSQVLRKEYNSQIEELQSGYYENESQTIKEFLGKHGEWKVNEKTLLNRVTLKKSHGDEEISVYFGREIEDYEGMMQDSMNEAAEDAEPNRIAERKGEEDMEEEPAAALIVNFFVVLSRGDKGAIEFDCLSREGQLLLQSCKFYPEAKMALEQSADSEYRRAEVYDGPALNNLDEEIIERFYEFLEERGIDNEFANFVQAFSRVKERRDNAEWLKFVGKFVDA